MPAAKGCPCGGEVRVRHAARRRAVAGRRERALDFGAHPCARGRPRSLGAGSESSPQTLSPPALRTIPEPPLFRPATTFKSIYTEINLSHRSNRMLNSIYEKQKHLTCQWQIVINWCDEINKGKTTLLYLCGCDMRRKNINLRFPFLWLQNSWNLLTKDPLIAKKDEYGTNEYDESITSKLISSFSRSGFAL